MQDKYLEECLDAIGCLVDHPEGAKVAARFAACTALQQNILRNPHEAITAAIDYLIACGSAPFSRNRAINYATYLYMRDKPCHT